MLTKTMLNRQKHCVCRFCGGPLDVRCVIFNKYGGAGAELYCGHCDKIEYGAEPEIYKTAKAFVDEFEYNYYMDLPEDQTTYELNIAKVCEILTFSAQRWGLATDKGLDESIRYHEDEEC